jgi:hypothetical protein
MRNSSSRIRSRADRSSDKASPSGLPLPIGRRASQASRPRSSCADSIHPTSLVAHDRAVATAVVALAAQRQPAGLAMTGDVQKGRWTYGPCVLWMSLSSGSRQLGLPWRRFPAVVLDRRGSMAKESMQQELEDIELKLRSAREAAGRAEATEKDKADLKLIEQEYLAARQKARHNRTQATPADRVSMARRRWTTSSTRRSRAPSPAATPSPLSRRLP